MWRIQYPICILVVFLVIGGNTIVPLDANNVPILYLISDYKLSFPLECGNYSTSALFLSPFSQDLNIPELIYNGGCDPESQGFLQAASTGSDIGFISDMGDLPLDAISAHTVTTSSPKTFEYIQNQHTYAISVAHEGIRAVFTIAVTSYEMGGPLTFDYAILLYEVHGLVSMNPEFSWPLN